MLIRVLLVLVLSAVSLLETAYAAGDAPRALFSSRIAALEKQHGGRIGVAVLNTANDEHLDYRGDERFALCSTFKVLLAATVLARVDKGEESLSRQVHYTAAALEDYAPIARRNLAQGHMTVAELNAAAIEYSDNTAANLLLNTIGGPAVVTSYVRSVGDNVTRLDRTEPTLNTNLTGDLRDTTTPMTMVNTLRTLLLGDALAPASRQQLIQWMLNNTTGGAKLRAGFDPSWKVGDKTGMGENGAANDVAIVWPGAAKPVLVAVYYSGSDASGESRSAVIAEIGKIVGSLVVKE